METLLKEYGFPGVKNQEEWAWHDPPRPSLPSPSARFEIILFFFFQGSAGGFAILRCLTSFRWAGQGQIRNKRQDLEASPLRAATLGEPTGICPAVEAQIVGETWVRHRRHNTTRLLPRAA